MLPTFRLRDQTTCGTRLRASGTSCPHRRHTDAEGVSTCLDGRLPAPLQSHHCMPLQPPCSHTHRIKWWPAVASLMTIYARRSATIFHPHPDAQPSRPLATNHEHGEAGIRPDFDSLLSVFCFVRHEAACSSREPTATPVGRSRWQPHRLRSQGAVSGCVAKSTASTTCRWKQCEDGGVG